MWVMPWLPVRNAATHQLTYGYNAFQSNDVQVFKLSHNSSLGQEVFAIFGGGTRLNKNGISVDYIN